eukprot:TRINITY_DN10499_c0_g2_i1.p1 TRINITY_DN10499_c0_g2~~TRINITY_DN10499_c0_g2_i1.p1  ORF type:complete len:509 (-),score=113.47 TRINITY_DN10499_c0_g2_i1:114-1640(-)
MACPFSFRPRLPNHASPHAPSRGVAESDIRPEPSNGLQETVSTEVPSASSAGYRRISRVMSHIAPEERGFPGPAAEDFVAYNTDNHHYITRLHEQYGNTFQLTRDGQKVLFARGNQELKQVLLSEDFGKTWDSEAASGVSQVDYVMNLIQPLLKNTVFNKHGEENAARRCTYRPLFTNSEEHFAPLFVECITGVMKEWQAGAVDIQDLCHDLLRKNMVHVLCGEFGPQFYDSLPVFDEVMEYFVQRYTEACHSQLVTEEDSRMMDRLFQTGLKIVAEFKALSAKVQEPSDTLKRCLLYLSDRAGISSEEMAATLVNVMIAAGEAPASILAQTLEEIAKHPDVQGKLLQEAMNRQASGGFERWFDGLHYTQSCITEGMRLFAPATLVQRSAQRHTTLAGFPVAKGTVVGVCVHSVHHNPEEWPEPELFNPDRPGLDYQLSRGMLTFSKGPRGCPGKHVAMAICKVALNMIAEEFELSVLPGQPPSAECPKVAKMVEWSVDGIPVALKRR